MVCRGKILKGEREEDGKNERKRRTRKDQGIIEVN
jgi:hypothetical protein